jgi:hypothetical protein
MMASTISPNRKRHKSKYKKVKAILKDKGRNKDPCMSFGCECAICKLHLSHLRRQGD